MDKLDALIQFVEFGPQRDEAIAIIVATPDSQEIAYTLTHTKLCNVLERIINGEIDIDDLELWANVIEAREEIDHGEVEGVIFALSNSEQMGEINKAKLIRLLALLTNEPE